MIGHIEHGSNFGGLFRYLLAPDKGARIIAGNAAGRTPKELTQEFNNCADQRRTTKKPVKHLIVSFSPEDGYVSDEVKTRIAKGAVEELGYTYNQYVVVDHHRDDPGHDWNHDHDHIHIAVNMITLDGKRVDDWQDKRKLESILRELEREENLTLVAPSNERKRKALSHGQVQRIKREISEYQTGDRTDAPTIPQMVKLQAAIDACCKDRPNLATMVGRLQHLGVDVRPTISDKGRKRISYAIGDLQVRGSKLHNGSFPKLIKERGVGFNLDRDKMVLDAAVKGEKIIIPQGKLVKWSDIDLVSYLPEALKKDIEANLLFLSPEINQREKLAIAVLNSNPDQVNTYLKNQGIRVAVESDSYIEIKETSGHKFTLLKGLRDDRGWEIESIINDEYTLKLLDLVAEAIKKTQHLKIEPKPKRSHRFQQSIKKKERGFELE